MNPYFLSLRERKTESTLRTLYKLTNQLQEGSRKGVGSVLRGCAMDFMRILQRGCSQSAGRFLGGWCRDSVERMRVKFREHGVGRVRRGCAKGLGRLIKQGCREGEVGVGKADEYESNLSGQRIRSSLHQHNRHEMYIARTIGNTDQRYCYVGRFI